MTYLPPTPLAADLHLRFPSPAAKADNRPALTQPAAGVTRRGFLGGVAIGGMLSGLVGCGEGGSAYGAADTELGSLEKVWGVHGIVQGRMHKPRAMAIDHQDQLYLVDFTARILVYDHQGNYLRGWQTPECTSGRPTGLTFDPIDRQILVADTHYYRVLCYSLDGELLEERTIGGTLGYGPGEFGFVTDAVRDSTGAFYVAEYGDHDRIQKFSPEGEFLQQWGTHGHEVGQFKRPQNLWMDANDRLWVCDACNHRMQVFDTEGELLFYWGSEGSGPGELYYPYDMVMDDQGDLYVCEFGNHRVQKFNPQGDSLGSWGVQGTGPGQLWNPWALVLDQKGRMHILDTNNHRVQSVKLT